MQDIEEQIESLEREIIMKKKMLLELRRQRSSQAVKDYVFRDSEGNEVSLSELFGDHRDLIVVQNMGKSCSYCTMWADGFNGIFKYVEEKAGFVLVSPDLPETQLKFRDERGWKFSMVSSDGTSFKEDTGFQDERGGQHPGVSVFKKGEDGKIYYTNRADFGPGDDFCAVWPFYDMLSTQS